MYFEQEVDAGPTTEPPDRIGQADDVRANSPQMAPAMVNRMWGHFFGYGFTRPVDDMGPHNPPSHPELLDRLRVEFVKSGYDLKQLIRWICQQRGLQPDQPVRARRTRSTTPPAGEMPLFSHMYVKPMTAEQLYDSLIIATERPQVGPVELGAGRKAAAAMDAAVRRRLRHR